MLKFGRRNVGMLSLLLLAVLAPGFVLAGETVMCLGEDGSVSLELSFDDDCRSGSASDADCTGKADLVILFHHRDSQSGGHCRDVEMNVPVIVLLEQTERPGRAVGEAETATGILTESNHFMSFSAGKTEPHRTGLDPGPVLSHQRSPALLL